MRIFVYDGRQIPDPDPSLSIEEVRLSLANYFHELANATHTERQEGETTYVEFKRTVGTKGAPGYPPGSGPDMNLAGESTSATIGRNSVLLLVRIAKPGNRRKVPSGMVSVDADAAAVQVSKELLECAELSAIGTLDGELRRWVYARSLPSAVLKDGAYRLPLALVEEVDAGLDSFQRRRLELIEEFLVVYPMKAQEVRMRLRSLYDARDYPDVAAMRSAFDLQWRYLAVDVPQALSAALIARERAKAQADIASEVEEIRLALRTSFAELVQHAASRLTSREDGRPQIFRDSLVHNMEEFFQYFQARNLTQDGELARMVEQARAVINGITPEDLRTQESLRQDVQQAMQGIKDRMDTSLMLKPARRITMATEKAA